MLMKEGLADQPVPIAETNTHPRARAEGRQETGTFAPVSGRVWMVLGDGPS